MVLLWLLATVEVVAVTVVDVPPAAIVTVPGTVTAELLDASVIVAPPAGAAAESVIVHILESPPATIAGEHDSKETPDDPVTVMLATPEVPPEPAMIVYVPEGLPVSAVAVKVPVKDPAATAKDGRLK
ncbi:MAG: hypothetical protein JO307_11160 [Bryobacterales bacterium]|nr:hypothetical protein [Bryobacterales bacterium]